jgi:Skp family chaperone for outer membrane proteins
MVTHEQKPGQFKNEERTVKRLGYFAVAVGATVLGIYLGTAVQTSFAQVQGVSVAASRTRVAVVNLNEVIKHYQKFKALRDESKQRAETYLTQMKNKQKRIDEMQTEYKTAAQQRKDQIEREVQQVKFEMETIKQDLQKTVGRYEEEQLAQIYREVYQVVKDVAAQRQIDMVFRYNEDWGDDYHQANKVVARMQIPFWPMWNDDSLEITGPVRETLNRRFAAAGQGNIVPAAATNKQK